jgi:branched-chain amino acid transport system ATP-binding protein
MGFTPPRRGNIKLEGMDLAKMPPYEICRLGIGYVPQDRRIFPTLSVEDNLEVVERKVEGGWTVEKIFCAFPILEPLKSRKGRHLSGGEQQILAVARPLMTNPKLLLLDEPSEGLAPLIVRAIEELVKSIITTGISVILAEQNMRFAMNIAQRGYIIDKGRIHHQGTIEELKEDKEIIGKYLAV